jgi:hypothetical protein
MVEDERKEYKCYIKKKKKEVRAQNSNFFPQNFFTSHPTRWTFNPSFEVKFKPPLKFLSPSNLYQT